MANSKAAFDAQMQAYADAEAALLAERAEAQAEMERRAQNREAAPFDPVSIPSFADIFQPAREAFWAAEEEAERARIAALSPHDIWLTTLSFQEQKRITTWERINHMQYPMPSSVVDDIAATKRLYEYEAAVQSQAQQTP